MTTEADLISEFPGDVATVTPGNMAATAHLELVEHLLRHVVTRGLPLQLLERHQHAIRYGLLGIAAVTWAVGAQVDGCEAALS